MTSVGRMGQGQVVKWILLEYKSGSSLCWINTYPHVDRVNHVVNRVLI